MKINQSNIVNFNNIKNKHNEVQNPIKSPCFTANEMSSVTPDYNISKPIAYTKIEDIQLPNDLTAHYYKLANGQKIVIVPKEGNTIIKTYVNTGSLNEPDRVRGISHYIEHNLFNGSEALGEKDFYDEVSKMGAYANASTSFSVTDYIIMSNLLNDEDLENNIKLQGGMLQTPKFLEQKLQKEKKIVDSEINMYLSDDNTKAVTQTLKNLFNIKSTAPDLIAGSTDNIDALTRNDVTEYFNNNYYPANMVTVITGEVDENKAINLIAKYFNSTKVPNKPQKHEKMIPTDKPVRQDMISTKKTGASDIYLAFAGPENGNEKDSIYLRAVNQLIFGLSNSKIKMLEEKYSASVDPWTERLGTRPSDKTAIVIDVSVPEDKVEFLLKDFYEILTNVANNPPTQEEFEAVKNQIKKTNSIGLESSRELNLHLGMDFLNGTHYKTANYASIIDQMTYSDFVNTVRKYYDLNKTALTIVHPKNSTTESIHNNYNKTKTQISFTGRNKKEPINLQNVKQYRMPNNFEITTTDENTDVVSYTIDWNTKDKSPKKAALSDVLNDMLQYCGTYKHSWEDLAKVSDRNGIASRISSSINCVELSGDFPVEKANIGLELFRENLQSPLFTQELFNNAIQHCKDAYASVEPNANQKYKKAMYEGTQKAYTVQDKADSLKDITFNDVIQLYNEILSKGQGQIVATGPFSKHPELLQMIFNQAGQFAPVASKDTSQAQCYRPIEKTQVHTIETRRNQAEIIQGYKFKQNGNVKDLVCLELLNSILGDGQSSRLFNDLREKRHLAYQVGSTFSTYGDIGVVDLRIKTTTNNNETGEKNLDNIQKSIVGFNENIKKIVTEKISEDELQRAKKEFKNHLFFMLERNSAKNECIASITSTPYGVTLINKKIEIVDSITADDILNTAKNVFAAKPIYSISGTKEALDYNKNFFETL